MLEPDTYQRSNLDAHALICEGKSSSGELLVNTTAVSDPDLERLYDILYKEAEVGVCDWVQCDLCNKWRRYHGSHAILQNTPRQRDMIEGLDCTDPEDQMEEGEVW